MLLLKIKYRHRGTTPSMYGHGGIGWHVPAIQPGLTNGGDEWLIESMDRHSLNSHVERAALADDLVTYHIEQVQTTCGIRVCETHRIR